MNRTAAAEQSFTKLAARNAAPPAEALQPDKPVIMLKRIGGTTYQVAVHFSQTSTETMNDKITRLIRREAMGPPQSQRLCGERRSDGVSELARLRVSEGYEVRDDEGAAV